MRALLTCFAILAASHSIAQQYTSAPEARTRGHLIFHPASKALLLFDGYSSGHLDSTQNHVWKWNGKAWTKISAWGPGSRILNAAAYDKGSKQIITSGGWGKGLFNDKKNDLWTFDGSKWTKIQTNDVGTHDHHKLVYLDHLKSFLMYGGFDKDFQPDTVTWILKGNSFTPHILSGPGPRGNFAMAYDQKRKRAVLSGGSMRNNSLADIWEYDGTQWERKTNIEIGVGSSYAMTYHEGIKKIIIHTQRGETWTWDGTVLTKIADNGPTESGVSMGYDPARKVVAVYGGFGPNSTASSSLWELKDSTWKKVSDNGTWRQMAMSRYDRMPDAVADIFHKLQVHVKASDLAAAQQLIEQGEKSDVKSDMLYNILADMQLAAGKYENAITSLNAAVQIRPIGQSYFNLARAYAVLNNIDKAFESLESAIQNGYSNKDQLLKHKDLDAVRSDSRFGPLLEKVK